MAQPLRALLFLTTQVQFPTPTWQLPDLTPSHESLCRQHNSEHEEEDEEEEGE